MKTFLHILILLLIPFFAANAQEMEEYLQLPIEYENPEPGVSASLDSERSDEPWVVYSDRDGVLIYEDQSLQTVIDTADFLESFVVWQESSNAVRLVSRSEPGDLYINRVFSGLAVERGWIRKDHLILWLGVLQKDGLQMKVIIPGSLTDPGFTNPQLPFEALEIPNNEFRIFNVIKSEGEKLLLMRTDYMHEYLDRSDLFWIHRNRAFLLESRDAYIPHRELVSHGGKLPVYSAESAAQNGGNSNTLFTITDINPYLGFLEKDGNADGIVSASAPYQGQMRDVFLDNREDQFEKAYLFDDKQFQLYKKLVQLMSSNDLYDPVDLETSLVEFFLDYGIAEEEIGSNSLARLFDKVTGISLPIQKHINPTRVGFIGLNKRHELTMSLMEVMDQLNGSNLEQYTFRSDMRYYWLPESWILPMELPALALSNTVLDKQAPKSYNQYEVFYIDGSSAQKTNLNVFNAMFDNLSERINRAAALAKEDDKFGVYAFLSNGYYSVKNDPRKPFESTMDEVLIQIAEGTSLPDKNSDKQTLESELLTKQLESIKDSLVMHYYVTQGFFDEDLWERGYMLLELPERIYSLTMPKTYAKTIVNINLYAITNEEKLNKDILEIRDYYATRAKHIEFRFNKFN